MAATTTKAPPAEPGRTTANWRAARDAERAEMRERITKAAGTDAPELLKALDQFAEIALDIALDDSGEMDADTLREEYPLSSKGVLDELLEQAREVIMLAITDAVSMFAEPVNLDGVGDASEIELARGVEEDARYDEARDRGWA